MALLVSDLITELENRKQDTSDVGETLFCSWVRDIVSFTYRALKKTEPERFITETDYTITTSPSSQALPSGFRDIAEWDTGFFFKNSDGTASTRRLAVTKHGSQNPGYYFEGGNVVFTGIESESVTLRYIPAPPTISATSDYLTSDKTNTGKVIIPDEFLDYVMQALDVRYSQWDEDSVSEGNADQRFQRVLLEMLDEYRRGPQVFALQPDNSIY